MFVVNKIYNVNVQVQIHLDNWILHSHDAVVIVNRQGQY